MNTATSTHPYPFDADAFALGQDHGRRNRYSLIQSTGAAWVYWYCEGRVDVTQPCDECRQWPCAKCGKA